MRHLVSALAILIGVLLMGVAPAMEMTALGTSQVVVPDRSSKALLEGMQAAFSSVLVKMTGNRGVMTLPQIQNMMPQVKRYVLRYHYSTQAEDTILIVSFNKPAVRKLLRQQGQALWHAQRPLSLVWLYKQEGGPDGAHLQLVSADASVYYRKLLQGVAQKRGVKLIFPVMDLSDEGDLSILNPQRIDSALLQSEGRRYGVSSVLVGVLDERDPNNVLIAWRLDLKNDASQWVSSGLDISAALTAGLDRFVDIMAGAYASLEGQALWSPVSVQVVGIDSLADYQALLAYLRHMPEVSDVSVLDSHNDVLLLSLSVAGGQAGLQHILSSSQNMQMMQGGPLQVEQTATHGLSYRWVLSKDRE